MTSSAGGLIESKVDTKPTHTIRLNPMGGNFTFFELQADAIPTREVMTSSAGGLIESKVDTKPTHTVRLNPMGGFFDEKEVKFLIDPAHTK